MGESCVTVALGMLRKGFLPGVRGWTSEVSCSTEVF